MKGDFTRSTFDPTKRYTSVRLQQGRVPLDADWNEAQDIGKHLAETTRIDIIGRCGFPEDDAGFGLEGNGEPTETLTFGPGKAYVDGLLCVNDNPLPITQQPSLPDYSLPEIDGLYLAYLDVWERHITALEDPDIKEVALGGPDTATRLKTVWQIKLEAIEASDNAAPSCANFGPSWQPEAIAGTCRLRARAEIDPTDERPCIVPAQAGYRRLENQLYRVEIHRSGPAGTATFKWSRDNGSIVAGWSGPDNLDDTLTVTSIGKDNLLRFAPAQWVELTDDRRELQGEPGELVRVNRAEGQQLDIDRPVNRATFLGNPKVRRWDHAGEGGAILVEEGRWIALESGVQVWFEPGGSYRTGDYWLIPARTIGATVQWPQTNSGDPILLEPRGIRHHYCSLGLLRRSNGQWESLQDCRLLFPPLTDLPLNTQACGEIAVAPEDDLQSIVDRIPVGGDAKLCLHPGNWQLTTTITIANKGNLVISGAGPGTQLFGQSLDRCLLFRNCESVAIRDIQASGGNVGETGDGLRGVLSFIGCESVTLESVRLTCNTFLSRRVSAVQIWGSRTSESFNRVTTDVCIRRCHLTVGHQQIGILIVNGAQVIVADNIVETPRQPFNLAGVLANAQDQSLIAAVGRQFMTRIAVGRDKIEPAALAALDRGDFGLGDPVEVISERANAAGQHRLLANVSGWGGRPFAFTSDSRLSAAAWSELLRANPIQPIRGPQLEARAIATRLRQLRSRLVRRLFGNTTVEISLPSIALLGLEQVRTRLEETNRLSTGSQGIVVGGDRTPRFGQQEPFANGLFRIDGTLAPTVTITNNQILGFAEGIHIGTSNSSSKAYRSYQITLQNNSIHLHAASLATERHGIFVGHAHSLTLSDNVIQVVEPAPNEWRIQQANSSTLSYIPPSDGIHLAGVYGPLLTIQRNHCIGVTRGINIRARNAGRHESRYNIVPAWKIDNNAYAGLGEPQMISSSPINRF